jgi:hypothetical protein
MVCVKRQSTVDFDIITFLAIRRPNEMATLEAQERCRPWRLDQHCRPDSSDGYPVGWTDFGFRDLGKSIENMNFACADPGRALQNHDHQ